MGTVIGGVLANLVSGVIVDSCESKSEMTIPMICVIKALIDVPFCFMTYFQHKNFTLAIFGIYLQLIFAKGWTAPAILILKTVVDPAVSNLSVAMFLFFQTIVYSGSASAMGYISTKFEVDPLTKPDEYGWLITAMTVVPCLLSVPFFLASGYKMRNIKRAQKEQGEPSQYDKNTHRDREFLKQFSHCGTDFNDFILTN